MFARLLRGFRALCLVLVLALLGLTEPASAQQQIWHVDASVSSSGVGTSWGTAFKTLQEALAEADPENDDVIWVADGTYKPGTSRTDSFELKDGVEIYGGFASGETDLADRDIFTNFAILSGEIGTGASTDNTFHVVLSVDDDSSTRLDGFTITGGLADGDAGSGFGQYARGAGMYITKATGSSAPILANLVISDNTAGEGIEQGFGGGLYADTTDAQFIDCIFELNSAVFGGRGGAAYIVSSGTTDVSFVNTLFKENAAIATSMQVAYGGAIVVTGTSASTSLVNCTVADNESTASGASTFAYAGGLYNGTFGTATITNSIFWGNTSSDGGSASADQILDQGGTTSVTVNYSDVEGGWSGTGSNNINSDPEFVSPPTDYRICETSPCVDVGDTTATPADAQDVDDSGTTGEKTPDLNHDDRDVDGLAGGDEVDMGTYESQCGALKCIEDLDGDGSVGFADLLFVLNNWTDGEDCVDDECDADLNGDDIVGFADLLMVLDAWGDCYDVCPCAVVETCDDKDLGSSCEGLDILMDDIENGTSEEEANARCWLRHFIQCHDNNQCQEPPGCPDDDPTGWH